MINRSELIYFNFEKIQSFPGVVSAVFTRLGGVSSGYFKSLNLGLHVNDEPDCVIENRKRVLEELAFQPHKLIAMNQVHSDNLKIVTLEEGGRGSYNYDDAIPETDALICRDRGVLLMAVVADCSVLTLYDPLEKAAAIAHCGWRGTVKKLPGKVINNLEKQFSTIPSNLIAGIAPSIGPDCFEVGREVLTLFLENFGSPGRNFFEDREDKLYLDLQKAISYQLLTSGVKEENIETLKICTSCRNDLFFSHRKEKGKTGRNGVFIGMR